VPGSESLNVDSNSAVPLYVFTLFLPISRSQKPFFYYIARKKWVIPLLGMICWASPLKVSDLEPGTLQVNAEMLFEKLNLIWWRLITIDVENASQQVLRASAKNHFVTQFFYKVRVLSLPQSLCL
jgi:hypothetical protein